MRYSRDRDNQGRSTQTLNLSSDENEVEFYVQTFDYLQVPIAHPNHMACHFSWVQLRT